MSPADSIPTRADIESKWLSLIDGDISRTDAHLWASTWVDGPAHASLGTMERSALQRLHGVDLVREDGADVSFVHSDEMVRAALLDWKADCAEYDLDPIAYKQRAVARARASVARDA